MQFRKAKGVQSSRFVSMWFLRLEKRASMSSWLWPLVRKLTVAPAILWRLIHMDRRRRVPLFFTSFTQLSACRFNHTERKSTLSANFPRPWQRISAVLDEPLVKTWGLRQTRTRYPWTNSVVEHSRRRLNFENSLLAIERLRGHACFWASIESKMQVISHSPNVVAPNLDLALAA